MTSTVDISGSESLVEPIRDVSRQLVRELGFMSTTLAGTCYGPAAVHCLIEIGSGRATTAPQLCSTLNLDELCVGDVLCILVAAGEVEAPPRDADAGRLSLTVKGYQSLGQINAFAQSQVLQALGRIDHRDAENILVGLRTYASSLQAQRTGGGGKPPRSVESVEIAPGYVPGLVGRALEMHMAFYSRHAGFGAYFESTLAKGLGELVARLASERNEAWTARLQGNIVGTVFVDGEDLGRNRAHLRAFIVDGEVRGGGVGRRLLAEAVAFVDLRGFEETHLWTFQGLDAARRLYEAFGFVLKEEYKGNQWGKEVTEQLFVRRSLPGKTGV